MSRMFRSDDTEKWRYGFGYGQYDATFGTETASWNGTTRFQAQGVITGTAGQTSFVKPSSWTHEGFCLLHQTRGTNAGLWELAYVDFSGASAVADRPLQNTYTSGAQIITLSNGRTSGYNNVTVSGTFSAPAWSGSTGGILAILARTSVAVNGTIYGTGKGFRGGNGQVHGNQYAPGEGNNGYQGEGTAGAGITTESANGNGGGGGGGRFLLSVDYHYACGGGGGGNGAAGTSGGGYASSVNGNGNVGVGGSAVGAAALTTINLGGGGGSGGTGRDYNSTAGGAGGAAIFIFAPIITVSGYIASGGANGGNGAGSGTFGAGGSGGGAGGSVLLKCRTATLGTSKVTAPGGSGGTGFDGQSAGGAGAVGRVHVDYLTSYTGTTSPTLDATNDKTLHYPGNRRSVV